MIGIVVYALAQFAMLRRLREEEELELLRAEQETPTDGNLNFLTPPTTAVTPPTPQNGTIPQLPPLNSLNR